MKIIVIHHSADFDGIFCREIARKFFGEKAEYLGWDYGQPVPEIPKDSSLFMLDISIESLMDFPGLIWIDHHKSAMDKFPSSIPGVRIDGVAACRLAWQYWFSVDKHIGRDFVKEDYHNRITTEPLAVRLAGEYDICDKRDPRAELFQHGLRSQVLDDAWPDLLSLHRDKEETVKRLLTQGAAIQFAKTEENKGIIESYGFNVDFEGLRFLACNHARFNSHLFTAGIKPEHDALLGFNWDGLKWRVSLYHAPGREQFDLSKIAVKYGGGGHKGACGFKMDNLQFLSLT